MKVKCVECGSPITRNNRSDEDGYCFACAEIYCTRDDYEPDDNDYESDDDDEPDYGGAFDGFTVTSDADGGL